MAMDPTSRPSFGSRFFRALRNFILLVGVVGLGVAALYAVSVLNSRTYRLEVADGRLVVMKGRLMPTGAEPWHPTDPALAELYAPIDLEGNTALAVVGTTYGDRDELDRALFTVLELIAAPRAQSDSPKDLERALSLIQRAERLRGLADHQQASLRRLQTDVAFYLARTRLDEARKQLESALEQLKLAGDAKNRHAREANQMLLLVQPEVRRLSEALRGAVHELSTPASSPPLAVPPPSAGSSADAGAAPLGH